MNEQANGETGPEDAAHPTATVETVDLELEPVATGSGRGRIATVLLGFATVAALIVGLVALSGGFSDDETAVASDEDTELDQDVEDDTSADSDSDSADADEEAAVGEEAMLDSTETDGADLGDAADSMVAMGAYSTVDQAYFAEGRGFVGIGYGPNGQVLSESADGTEWSQVEVTGIAPEGQLVYFTATDQGWLALLEIWPEFDGTEATYLVDEPTPDRFLATSEDLVNWTTTPLPTPDDGTNVYFEALAVSNGRVVLAGVGHNSGGDELRLLVDAGRLSEDDLTNMCGWDGAYDGQPFIVFSCDHDLDEAMMALEEQMAGLDSDEEQAAIEAEMDALVSRYEEPEPLLVIEPDDPIYPSLAKLTQTNYEPQGFTVTGPIGGPFELTSTDYYTSVASTPDGFVAINASFNDDPSQLGASTVFASTNGTSWTEIGTVDSSWGRITSAGDTLIISGESPNGAHVLSSVDGGATWTTLNVESALFGGWAEVVTGPAGVVVTYQGSTQPLPEVEVEPTEIVLEKDGYILVNSWALDTGAQLFTLTGPDGSLLYEVSEAELDIEDGVPGKLRFGGEFGERLIFLDPNTGEDLVAFTEEDYEEAYGEAYNDEEYALGHDYAAEVWFSVDGTSWRELDVELISTDGSYSRIVAVGDDEVLVVKQRWSDEMPPADLLAFEGDNREPTEAEIAALDAWSAEQNTTEWIRIPLT